MHNEVSHYYVVEVPYLNEVINYLQSAQEIYYVELALKL